MYLIGFSLEEGKQKRSRNHDQPSTSSVPRGPNLKKFIFKPLDLFINLSASGCCLFATRDLITLFSLTSSRLTMLKFAMNSSFLLSQNKYVSFRNFDQTKFQWMIFAARFESAMFEKLTLVADTESLIKLLVLIDRHWFEKQLSIHSEKNSFDLMNKNDFNDCGQFEAHVNKSF